MFTFMMQILISASGSDGDKLATNKVLSGGKWGLTEKVSHTKSLKICQSTFAPEALPVVCVCVCLCACVSKRERHCRLECVFVLCVYKCVRFCVSLLPHTPPGSRPTDHTDSFCNDTHLKGRWFSNCHHLLSKFSGSVQGQPEDAASSHHTRTTRENDGLNLQVGSQQVSARSKL